MDEFDTDREIECVIDLAASSLTNEHSHSGTNTLTARQGDVSHLSGEFGRTHVVEY